MARTGISKQQVKEALLTLESRNAAVTIDAVRVELGNTGSKTTISRYMSELADEKAARMDKESYVGDKLMVLVGELAKGLNDDARAIVEQTEKRHKVQTTALEERNQKLQEELTASQEHVAILLATIAKMEEDAEKSATKITALELDKVRFSEKETSLKTQLKLKNDQITSLEDKHQHARDSLEHYRESVQTQREQEQTRHESQVQQISVELQKCQNLLSIKQEETSQLSNALTREKTQHKTTTEQKQLVDSELKNALSELHAVRLSEQSHKSSLLQLAEENQGITRQNARLDKVLEEKTQKLAEIQKENTQLHSQLETKDLLYTQLMTGLAKLKPSSTATANPEG
ncbi:MAG: DNA-binding protein [Aestuariibacter sp.]